MAELRMLAVAEAADELGTVPAAARGFLDLDPVTQNAAVLAAELTRRQAQVYRAPDGTLLGYAPNPDQPGQAYVASTSARPEPVAALLEHLHAYRRTTSYVALVPAGAAPAEAFTGCGFRCVGTLREHRYQSGRHVDVLVYFAKAAQA